MTEPGYGTSLYFGDRYIGPLPEAEETRIQVLHNPNLSLDGQPCAVSVHLHRSAARASLVDETADARARITYQNGVVGNTFYCDWDGQFTLPCTRLTIELESYTPTPEAYARYQDNVHTFAAGVAFGSVSPAGVDGLGYTGKSVDLSPIVNSAIEVPQFARRFYPLIVSTEYSDPGVIVPARPVSADGLQRVAIYFLTGAGYTLAAHYLTHRMMTEGLIIPAGTQRISVVDDGRQILLRLLPFFRLGL